MTPLNPFEVLGLIVLAYTLLFGLMFIVAYTAKQFQRRDQPGARPSPSTAAPAAPVPSTPRWSARATDRLRQSARIAAVALLTRSREFYAELCDPHQARLADGVPAELPDAYRPAVSKSRRVISRDKFRVTVFDYPTGKSKATVYVKKLPRLHARHALDEELDTGPEADAKFVALAEEFAAQFSRRRS
jgi:hypothetical protein